MVIKEITGEQPVSGKFLIVENQLRVAKNGTNFLAMKISDQTGEIAVKVWDATEDLFNQLEAGRVIELFKIQPKVYKDQIQLEWDGKNSSAFKLVSEEEGDDSLLLPHAPGNLAALWEYLKGIMETIRNPVLKMVLKVFFDDREFVALFLKVPAALKRHHAYIGGLVEHTAGVTALCEAAAGYYPLVNRDILLTGAMLHDIGKTRTYKVINGFDGTDEGKLIGHLVLGMQMVERAFERVLSEDRSFSEADGLVLRNQLLHLLISHHGIMEWGSPIEPLTLEACMLHHADNMDAQVTKFLTIIRNHQGRADWAPFDAGLGKAVYLGRKPVEVGVADGVEETS